MVELRDGRGTPVSAESASRSIVERVKSPGTVSPAGNPILSDAESKAPQWGQLAAAGGVSALQLGQIIGGSSGIPRPEHDAAGNRNPG
jgi:hypothetical protein